MSSLQNCNSKNGKVTIHLPRHVCVCVNKEIKRKTKKEIRNIKGRNRGLKSCPKFQSWEHSEKQSADVERWDSQGPSTSISKMEIVFPSLSTLDSHSYLFSHVCAYYSVHATDYFKRCDIFPVVLFPFAQMQSVIHHIPTLIVPTCYEFMIYISINTSTGLISMIHVTMHCWLLFSCGFYYWLILGFCQFLTACVYTQKKIFITVYLFNENFLSNTESIIAI